MDQRSGFRDAPSEDMVSLNRDSLWHPCRLPYQNTHLARPPSYALTPLPPYASPEEHPPTPSVLGRAYLPHMGDFCRTTTQAARDENSGKLLPSAPPLLSPFWSYLVLQR